jgi:hypothetical protein
VGLYELGIRVSAADVAVTFVDALTENLFMWTADTDRLRIVGVQFQLDKMKEDLALASPNEPPRPAVRAWISVATSPPEIVVYNDGASPIFEVIPTPAVIARDLDGQRRAMIGAGPLTNDRAPQIAPDEGWCWPLEHMRSWSASPLVFSQLHVEFTDNAGRKWRLAHDRLMQLR